MASRCEEHALGVATGSPALAWSGTELLAVWGGDTDLFVRRLDAYGAPIDAGVSIAATGTKANQEPAVIWDGTQWAISWSAKTSGDADVYFARVATDGTVTAASRVTTAAVGAASAALAWTGSRYAMSWRSSTAPGDSIYVGVLAASGTSLGSPMRMSQGNGVKSNPAVAWDGTELHVLWSEVANGSEHIKLAHANSSGVAIGNPLDVVINNTATPVLAQVEATAAFGAIGVVWNATNRASFEQCDAAGNTLDSEMLTTSANGRVAIAQNGSTWGVAWVGPTGLQFQEYSVEGKRLGQRVRFGDTTYPATRIALTIGDAGEYVVAWIASPRHDVMVQRICVE